MSAREEAQTRIRELALPIEPGQHVSAMIRVAARRAGLGYARAKAFWYGEAQIVTSEEMDALRAAVKTRGAAEDDLFRSLQEARALLDRLEREMARRSAARTGANDRRWGDLAGALVGA